MYESIVYLLILIIKINEFSFIFSNLPSLTFFLILNIWIHFLLPSSFKDIIEDLLKINSKNKGRKACKNKIKEDYSEIRNKRGKI